MAKKLILFLVCLLPFGLYHSNLGGGPDSSVYLAVAHRIVSEGHLNTLPHQLSSDNQWQVTPAKHAPIHQNVGGVIFFLPATAFAFASLKVAALIPNLPPELYDINYHERVWVGCTAYALALAFCLLTVQVARRHCRPASAVASLLACLYGGPLLIYTVAYPCQMNLPAAFLAALLLAVHQTSDWQQRRSWLLMGAIWGLGVFVRFEFVVWGLLLAHALIASRQAGRGGWSVLLTRAALAAGGALLFVVPGGMVRQVIFGTQGSTYGIQFDLAILARSYLMLIGARNGLFTFWPVLLLALLGYGRRWRKNSPLFHILFAILCLEALICGATNFWSGEFGNSFGQRRFLVVLPCFVLFLARLFDEVGERQRPWLAALCLSCSLWSLAIFDVYGKPWLFSDGMVGFLMPYHYSLLLGALASCSPELPANLFALLFLPKHGDMIWLFPFVTALAAGGYCLCRPLARYRATLGLVALCLLAVATTFFLAGARQRGEAAFAKIAAANPQARFITRNYEIDGEIVGSMVDSVSFFLELHQEGTAAYFTDKTLRFLAVEAPDQVEPFRQMAEALALRQSLGWYRLVPEQSHEGLLAWYQMAKLNSQAGQPPPDISARYLY